MSEHPTKDRILDAAEELMLEKSFHSVGLNEILKAVDIPKGSFYHHFASKEIFGVELIRHYSEQATSESSDILLNKEIEPNARLRIISHLESGIAKFIENGGKCPCLILKLATETGSSSAIMREQISAAYSRKNSLYTGIIQEGIDAGHIATNLSAQNTSALLMALWLGALMQSLGHQKADILRTALTHISNSILPAGDA